MDGLIEGRVVHYVPQEGDGFRNLKRHLPAMVVGVPNRDAGLVNLQVFVDGSNDQPLFVEGQGTVWKTTIPYSAAMLPGTWHWIERA